MYKKTFDWRIKRPVYIWGSGEVARLTAKKLNSAGLKVDGFVVDERPELCRGGVLSPQEVLSHTGGYTIVRGFLGSFYMSERQVMDRWPGCVRVCAAADMYEPEIVEPLTEEFLTACQPSFQAVRDMLADRLSLDSFDAYIEAKRTARFEPLLPYVVPTQYFFEDPPWTYDDHDVLLDAGAFNGDSIADFLKLRGSKYRRIIACEPDEMNFRKLEAYVAESGYQRIRLLRTGLYHRKTELSFRSGSGMESVLDAEGAVTIDVDTVDHICEGEHVSVIKMDIEGAEKDALAGSGQTIRKYHPILMISAYHKKEDLIRIPEAVNRLYDGYIWFFRCHKPLAIDAVLYAVPKDRMIHGYI